MVDFFNHRMMKLKPLFSSNSLSVDQFGSLLQRCMKSKTVRPGKQVHAMLLASGTDLNALSLHSKLVAVYANCGDLRSAGLVFERIQNPNVFGFNWMVSASAFHGFYNEAIGYFCLMQEFDFFPNMYTFSAVLKACVGLMDVNKGKEIHAVITRTNFESNVLLGSGLIDMYCKCGSLNYARRVFDNMVERNVTSWTCMICGYCNVGNLQQALVLFERMKLNGLEPNEFTWNAMITGYARSGDCNGAFVLFSRMKGEGLVPDLVTWNAMITGFAQSRLTNEGLELFRDMLVGGIRPNNVTVTGLLPACGLTGSVQRGKEIHGLIYRMGTEINVFVASALTDMYSKCGSVKYAWNVFDQVPVKNVACWNAMIGCYGKHGMVDSSIHLFERMQEARMQANQVTLICVLSACSHGGLVEKGLSIFKSIKESYGVEVSKEHYACVVDLLCRSGRMVEAYEFVKRMPIKVTDSIVGAFFNGCKIHGRKDLAKIMAKDIFRMELKRPGGFVTLSNIYAADEEWEEVENVRKVMKEKGVHKKPGSSWVEKRKGFVELLIDKENNRLEFEEGQIKAEEDVESKDAKAIGVRS